MSEKELESLVRKHFDLRPKSLINALQLKRPIYKDTAAYGHFGRSEDNFSWEKIDLSNILGSD
jgi:S-adenosylmethionine synthetase